MSVYVIVSINFICNIHTHTHMHVHRYTQACMHLCMDVQQLHTLTHMHMQYVFRL